MMNRKLKKKVKKLYYSDIISKKQKNKLYEYIDLQSTKNVRVIKNDKNEKSFLCPSCNNFVGMLESDFREGFCEISWCPWCGQKLHFD